MKLVISEKPSVAKSIAEAVGAGNKRDGYFEGNGYMVSWCYGHLIEMAQPQDYDEKYEKWTYESLPIIPSDWIYKVKDDTKEQYIVLKKLMHSSEVETVVNACDAGREGENIFRHVYDMAECDKPMERLWISSMEESAVRDGMNSLRPGSEYDNLYKAALAREKADWIVGMNLTRNFTVLYRSKVLKIGRVQTPTLAMLVQREMEITDFKKQKYYVAHLMVNGIDAVSERMEDGNEANRIAEQCHGKTVTVSSYKSELKKAAPPKLYDLTSLQMEASKLFGFTAKQTLDYTQSLYEKKLVTYPRTDSKFLTHNEVEKVEAVTAAIVNVIPFLAGDSVATDTAKIVNDKKVTDHHAIIPTMEIERADLNSLLDSEKKVLFLISARLIAATAEPMEYCAVKAEFECEKNIFRASGKTIIKEGYQKYEDSLKSYFKASEENDDTSEPEQKLPELSEGMTLNTVEEKVTEHFTKPPKRFTEATLLSQMERAGSRDMNDDVERKGLGTTATRADIIEKIIKQGYVRREKKTLVPTDDGMKLITVLPDEIKSVQMTVDMENTLAEVASGKVTDTSYLEQISDFVRRVVEMYSAISSEDRNLFSPKQKLGDCPFCGGDVVTGKYGVYCEKKCGMRFGKIMGKHPTENQWKDILAGKCILLRGLKSKKDTVYDAYFTPETIEDYHYADKENKEHYGKQFKFKMEFPQKKK